MTKSLFEQATDPQQYDLEALYWTEMGAKDSPTRQFFKEYLNQELNPAGKDILDIGSGTGWLLEELRENRAQSVTGIEPSESNVALAKKVYPQTTTLLSSLEDFKSDKKYDIVTSVMVMVHVADVEAAMKKIASLLKFSGELHILVPPYEYTKTPRFNYEIKVEQLNEDEYVAVITRSIGTIVDVIRKTSVYQKAGARSGLKLKKVIEMKPTKSFLQREPKYEQFKDVAIGEYLVFTKQ